MKSRFGIYLLAGAATLFTTQAVAQDDAEAADTGWAGVGEFGGAELHLAAEHAAPQVQLLAELEDLHPVEVEPLTALRAEGIAQHVPQPVVVRPR